MAEEIKDEPELAGITKAEAKALKKRRRVRKKKLKTRR